jgi:hypothetical protein
MVNLDLVVPAVAHHLFEREICPWAISINVLVIAISINVLVIRCPTHIVLVDIS